MSSEQTTVTKCATLPARCLAILVLMLAVSMVPVAEAQQGNWWGELFANPNLSGAPVLTRTDDRIDFDWGTGSPGAGVPADGFSVRWTRAEWFDSGTYRFYARSDDGLRVWVGDLLVIDSWVDQQGGWVSRDLYVGEGTLEMRVEYYERAGGALVSFNWERLTGGHGWQAEYYSNQSLNGAPAVRRTESAIDFAWGDGSPDAAVPADHFSARWTYTLGFSAGTYRFLTSTDDGVRLWVDEQLVVDAWLNQRLPNTHWGDTVLGEGLHQIRVEYYEDGGEAHAHAWWQRVGATFTGWIGEYYDNPDLVGGAALVRDDPTISFDWGAAPPVSWMPDDNFSARWTRELSFDPGYYRLSVRCDDGVRVWIDETLVIDRWEVMDNELHYVDGIHLSGAHELKVEYFERSGLARIQLWIGPAATPSQPAEPTIVPRSMAQGPWQVEYFANPGLSGSPTLVRHEGTIGFNWQSGSPDATLPTEGFSARWTATLDFPAGRYQFKTHTDDGVRLYVDGELLINNWHPMRGYRYATRSLVAGPHTVVMEYFERTEAALAQLGWTWIGPLWAGLSPD